MCINTVIIHHTDASVKCQNVALDIFVNVVRTKILLIFISFLSFVFIFVLVLVSSTIIQNVFVIFAIVLVVFDGKTLVLSSTGLT